MFFYLKNYLKSYVFNDSLQITSQFLEIETRTNKILQNF